jgi:3-hydroxybutyryl-CoA dehydrogenase
MNESRSLADSRAAPDEVNLVVVGIGRMGCGIALSFAYAGYAVTLVDSEARSAQAFAAVKADAAPGIQADLAFLQSIGALSAAQAAEVADRIAFVAKADSAGCLAQADFVFEAVAEVLEVKQSTYAWLSQAASSEAVFASTTSTMLADTLAEFVEHKARFSNAHWLNPAYLMPLIEISPARETSADSVARLKVLFEKIGKKPVVCTASPGYIVSRLQALALNESARMVEEGVASAEDIDKAVRYGFGIRYAVLGMLEFIDWGGGDILYYACNYLAKNIDEQRFAPAQIVKENMANNNNGLRDGVGFYNYQDMDVEAYRNDRLAAFAGLLKHLKLMPAVNGAASAGDPSS